MGQDRTATASPTNSSKKPIGNAATIKPQIAMVTGFSRTALSDVSTATAKPTSRSSNKGNEMTLMLSTPTAKTQPIALPRTIRVQPRMW
jgi:hypothetical protein